MIFVWVSLSGVDREDVTETSLPLSLNSELSLSTFTLPRWKPKKKPFLTTLPLTPRQNQFLCPPQIFPRYDWIASTWLRPLLPGGSRKQTSWSFLWFLFASGLVFFQSASISRRETGTSCCEYNKRPVLWAPPARHLHCQSNVDFS